MSTPDAAGPTITPTAGATRSSTGTAAAAPVRCPCLSGETYAECCAPYHRGEADAPTAERLMRSRYSAFAVGDPAYLLATWHPQTRPDAADFVLDDGIRWYRLDIVARSGGGVLDTEGEVEFVAHYKPRPAAAASPAQAGADADGVGPAQPAPAAGQQHERSRFVREGGRWYYLDAI
ncbi:YchJ family protein [Herbiconiux sp. YIM B11900]|uniref:YchJ family protein n=1 Tax=Herbiconiux sp. YIM B11900 TaxID=3404131 RepID=UPI003F85FDC0